MYVHEAEWARKIGPAMLGQLPNFRLLMIRLYAHRYEIAQILALEKIETGDIDAILTYMPWTEEGLERYSAALKHDLIPPLVTLYAFGDRVGDKGFILAAFTEKLLIWIEIARKHPSKIEIIGNSDGPDPSQMIYDKVWTFPNVARGK